MRRTESNRERTLLRVIEQQQKIIERLENKLMLLVDRPWDLPPPPVDLASELEPETDFEFPEMTVLDEAP